MEEDIERLGDQKDERLDKLCESWEIKDSIYSIQVNINAKSKICGMQVLLRSSSNSIERLPPIGVKPTNCVQKEIVFSEEEKVTQVQICYIDSGLVAAFQIKTDEQTFNPVMTPELPITRKVIYDFNPGTFAGLFGSTYLRKDKPRFICRIGFLRDRRSMMLEHGECQLRVNRNLSRVGNPIRLDDKKLDASSRYKKGWEILMPIYSIRFYVFQNFISGIYALHPSSYLETKRTELYGHEHPEADHRELVFGRNEIVLEVSISHYRKTGELATLTITTNKKEFRPIETPLDDDFDTVSYQCKGSFAGIFGYNYAEGDERVASIGILREEDVCKLGCSTCVCRK